MALTLQKDPGVYEEKHSNKLTLSSHAPSIPAVMYVMVLSMVSECSVSEVDGEMDSRGPDSEGNFE